MATLDFLWHALALVAPAVGLGLMVGAAARLWWGAQGLRLPWLTCVGVNVVVGMVALVLGLVLTGHDGDIGSYAAAVLAVGTSQWLLIRAPQAVGGPTSVKKTQ